MKRANASSLVSPVVVPLVFAAPDEQPKVPVARTIRKQGPNQNGLITGLKPHLEFPVTGNRRVRLLFVDDENKAVMRPEVSVSLIGSDPSNPIRMRPGKTRTGYLSVEKLSEGRDLPTIPRGKRDADARRKTIPFNLNLNESPTSDLVGYHCPCKHGGDDGLEREGPAPRRTGRFPIP